MSCELSDGDVVVLYHAACYDGFCAAWVTHTVLPDAEFIPCHHGSSPPDVTGKKVYVLDFSYPADVMLSMQASTKIPMTVIDHHAKAMHELIDAVGKVTDPDFPKMEIVFDVEHSAGRLTFDYFQEAIGLMHIPWIVEYTEDRDLFKHALRETHAVNAALRSYPFSFETWNVLSYSFPLMIQEGTAILRYKDGLVESHAKHAYMMHLGGHVVPVACISTAGIVSDVLARLAVGHSFSASYFVDHSRDIVVFSLRSASDGVDVSEVAARFGGGGHKHAASFRMSFAAFSAWYKSNRIMV
jgi:oligoribonuclease NrnB/cAMP/cGMP phosphodiesterase (DHH superfamily)